MGKAGRIACITLPYILSIASLICIILVGVGSTSKNSTVDDYYFMKADLKNFTSNPDVDLIKGTSLDNKFTSGLLSANSSAEIKDFYLVGLWNYCSGDYTDGQYKVTNCTERHANFWFDPVTVWGLNGTGIEDDFPTALKNGLNAYKKVAHWMFIAYAIAFFATIAELVIGITAIFSRWGSLFTSICSGVSTFFIVAASITSTALYGTLVGTFNTALKAYQIHGTMGRQMFIATWVGAAFSIGAGLFWLFSTCCCSGRSPYSHNDRKRGMTAEKTPYTYERVESPYIGAAGNHQHGGTVPMHNMGHTTAPHNAHNNAYEPFRAQHV